jgi:hypothetical protein
MMRSEVKSIKLAALGVVERMRPLSVLLGGAYGHGLLFIARRSRSEGCPNEFGVQQE